MIRLAKHPRAIPRERGGRRLPAGIQPVAGSGGALTKTSFGPRRIRGDKQG
jgi:hypothetical protein